VDSGDDSGNGGRPDRGWLNHLRGTTKGTAHEARRAPPGGPASIGPTLSAVGRAADEAGVANLSLMDH
jgi:hypothetical protein